jgi:uncharacterized BrkB/YihY/UPF0761 family membrane protein
MPATYHVPEFVTLGGSQIWGLLREAGSEWMNDKAPRLGASLAYYALLSLAPLLVVAVAVAALAFGRTAAEGQLFWQTRELLGPDGAAAVQALIRNANIDIADGERRHQRRGGNCSWPDADSPGRTAHG